MKNTIKYIAIAIISQALGVKCIFAQDTHSSMPFADPINLNPALNGANKDLKLLVNYRNQWGSLDGGFQTKSATLLYPLFVGKSESSKLVGEGNSKSTSNNVNSKLDFGLGVRNYSAGAFTNMDISLSIGYNLRIADNHYLSAAILGSYVQNSLNTTDLTFDEQYVLGSYDALNPNNETILNEKTNYPTVGFGLLWYYNESTSSKINSYLGVSGYNLNKPNESLLGENSGRPRKYSFQGGIKIIGENKIDVTPNVIYTVQNSSQLLAAGIYLDYRLSNKSKLVIGSWYKINDALTFLVGFDYKVFTIGYGYDLVTSGVTKAVSGLNTHSITLSVKLDQANKKNLTLNNPFSSF